MTWAPAAVFFGFLALVLGAYWLFVLREERRIIDRLRPRSESEKVRRGILKKVPRSSEGVKALGQRIKPLVQPIRVLIEQAASRQTVEGFLLRSATLALATGVALAIGLVRTGLPHPLLAGLLGGAAFGAIPFLLLRRARTKRIFQFEEQFPEAVDLISRALRAGHALPTGLGMVADEMPAPVGREFRIVFDEQNFGLTLSVALQNFARRVPVLDARFFVVAVLTQLEAGGNLAEVLDNLSSVIRERFKVKRQVQVISAHGRITGTILTMMPPCLAIFTAFASGGETIRAFMTPIGQKMIIGAVILQVLGALSIRKIVKIEY
jgi:tight adherence protein B